MTTYKFTSDDEGSTWSSPYQDPRTDDERTIDRALGLPDPDPLQVDEIFGFIRVCRACECTDARACWPTCSWVEDPLRVGDLCSRCLEIARRVYARNVVDSPTMAPVLGLGCALIAGAIVGATVVLAAHLGGLL